MIFYSPTDGDALRTLPALRPRTCFLMTQLGEPLPPELRTMRRRIIHQLRKNHIGILDADSVVTGKDFLDKIWRMIISVPMGIAVIHENMPPKTVANVFYELGMMDALGKRTLVVKSHGAAVPSDFVRTEYVVHDKNFERRIKSFIDSSLEQESYFVAATNELETNPLLAIDYLRRAYLVSGDARHRLRAQRLLNAAGL